MARTSSLALFVSGAAVLFAVREIRARCMDSPVYYCAAAVFEREMPELRLPAGTRDCAGLVTVSGESVTVLLPGEKSCPPPGTRLVGHLVRLCQEHEPRRTWPLAEPVAEATRSVGSPGAEVHTLVARSARFAPEAHVRFPRCWLSVIAIHPPKSPTAQCPR